MVVPSVFELQSIKDQLSLLSALTSHLNWIKYQAGEFDESSIEDFKQLLNKMDHSVRNLEEKKQRIEDALDT